MRGDTSLASLAELPGPLRGTRPAPPHGIAVRIRGLTKQFGSGNSIVQALRGIDWDIDRGRMSLIVGPSGCGKTTLLSVIAGILDSDEGEVTVLGHSLTAMGERRKTGFRGRHVGFVFQQHNLLPALTAAENAAIPLVIAGWRYGPALRRANDLLASLGLASKVGCLPGHLSGGQQQRVAIARALAHEPDLLVCDEPTAALDHENGLAVMRLLRDAAVRPHRAVVVVTHDQRLFHFGDRIVRMDDGRIVAVQDKSSEPAV